MALAGFVGSWIGLATAAGGLLLAWWRGPRWTGAAAVVALAVAAFATVLQGGRNSENYASDFAALHPVATRAGLVAAVLLGVTLAVAALSERASPTE
jgi:hypothetical protein